MKGVEFVPHPDTRMYGYQVTWERLGRPKVVVAEMLRMEAGRWLVVMLDGDGKIIQGAGMEGTNAECKRALNRDGVRTSDGIMWSGSFGYIVEYGTRYPLMVDSVERAREVLRDGGMGPLSPLGVAGTASPRSASS